VLAERDVFVSLLSLHAKYSSKEGLMRNISFALAALAAVAFAIPSIASAEDAMPMAKPMVHHHYHYHHHHHHHHMMMKKPMTEKKM
jgi:hypothetical protein